MSEHHHHSLELQTMVCNSRGQSDGRRKPADPSVTNATRLTEFTELVWITGDKKNSAMSALLAS